MNESTINFADTEKDILTYEVSDQAVEAAAALLEGQGKNATISFCSGLDSAPPKLDNQTANEQQSRRPQNRRLCLIP
jgi:hypothetical protein